MYIWLINVFPRWSYIVRIWKSVSKLQYAASAFNSSFFAIGSRKYCLKWLASAIPSGNLHWCSQFVSWIEICPRTCSRSIGYNFGRRLRIMSRCFTNVFRWGKAQISQMASPRWLSRSSFLMYETVASSKIEYIWAFSNSCSALFCCSGVNLFFTRCVVK